MISRRNAIKGLIATAAGGVALSLGIDDVSSAAPVMCPPGWKPWERCNLVASDAQHFELVDHHGNEVQPPPEFPPELEAPGHVICHRRLRPDEWTRPGVEYTVTKDPGPVTHCWERTTFEHFRPGDIARFSHQDPTQIETVARIVGEPKRVLTGNDRQWTWSVEVDYNFIEVVT